MTTQEQWRDWLNRATRLVIRADWTPIQSDRFQPTGFPNLGPAQYRLPDGTDVVVVESPQSMVNRLEGLSWDVQRARPIALWQGLPWVEVVDAAGHHLTSSREEPHRLFGAWLRDSTLASTGQGWIPYLIQAFGLREGRALDWSVIYPAIYRLDPYCLVHGVFFAHKKLPGQPKVARAITPTMDAFGAQPVTSGGVKKEVVSMKSQEGQSGKEGYGFIPFSRVEFVAERIESRFVIDVEQLRGYRLKPIETEVLFLLALWEAVDFVGRPERLRTFCDLQAAEAKLLTPQGDLPTLMDLEAAIRERVSQEVGEPLRLVHEVQKETKVQKEEEEEGEHEDEDEEEQEKGEQ